MNYVVKDDLTTLLNVRKKWCVSIYMPTYRTGRARLQGPIRLKNLFGRAEEILQKLGAGPEEIEALLRSTNIPLADHKFWQQRRRGLALFISPDMVQSYRLPERFTEKVFVAERFYLKPLLPFLNGNGRFYVLALSMNEFRLLEGNRDEISEIELENVPESLTELLKYKSAEKQLQYRGVPNGRGGAMAMYHGHGTKYPNEEENILGFFRKIDQAVKTVIPDGEVPMVLAGVEPNPALYRRISMYPNLEDTYILGSPERLRDTDLHRRAWEIVSPRFLDAQRKALARYKALAHTARGSEDPRRIVPAAYYGQIEVLMIARGASQWGVFDRENSIVEIHPEKRPESEGLYDLAAVHCLGNGGRVFVVEPEILENDLQIAAIFRYPLEQA